MLPPVKKSVSSESGDKSAQIKLRLQAKTALNKYVSGYWCEREQEMDFSPEKALLWIMDSYLAGRNCQVKWWICFLQTHSFWLQKMLSDGLEGCGLLWCFYQLFGLSFWRHPFTAEHPLMSKWRNATFLQIWWRNKIIYILDGLRVRTFSAHFHFYVQHRLKGFSKISWRNETWVFGPDLCEQKF